MFFFFFTLLKCNIHIQFDWINTIIVIIRIHLIFYFLQNKTFVKKKKVTKFSPSSLNKWKNNEFVIEPFQVEGFARAEQDAVFTSDRK